jgi:nicotinamide-nucleotide amidase
MSQARADQAAAILEKCRQRGIKLGFAESLTGGALCSAFVDVPGASDVVIGSVVAYDSSIKNALLRVDQQLIAQRGVVNAEAAEQMARGGLALFEKADASGTQRLLVVATTGVAGPTEQDGQPVGTVFISIAAPDRVSVSQHEFAGDRASIRQASVDAALGELAGMLDRP